MISKVTIALNITVLIAVFAISLSLLNPSNEVLTPPQALAIGNEDIYEYFITPPESNETGNETGGGDAPVSEPMGSSTVDCWNDSISPHPICSCDDLNNIRNHLNWEYELQNDIDFSACDASYTSGAGWEPIGDNSNKFTGNFDGNNHIISNLYINLPTEINVGLFGYIDNYCT